MARPRTFEVDEVLDAARDLFWSKGYRATSLDDVTDATGLTKPSLYAAFGDKSALFARVLDRYHERVLAFTARTLREHATAAEAVTAWLTSLIPLCSGAKGRRGCLSVNTGLDGGLESPAVAKSVATFNVALEGLLLARLNAGRAEFASEFDPVAATRAIMTLYAGLMATARSMPSRERVASVIAQAVKLLA